MNEILEFVMNLDVFIPLLRTIIVVIILLLIHRIISRSITKRLLKKAKTKKHKSDVQIFSKLLNYLFIFSLIIFIIISYAGSLTGLGVGIGLFTAALGWALQTPITGFAAWIMVITKRPFNIGDRIIIGDMKGEVSDITPTHVYLKEVGGTIPTAEDYSGRTVMIPNVTLFNESIINYTMQDDFILSQVILSIPYECNLDKAVKIAMNAAEKYTKDFQENNGTEKPYIRLSFEASSVDIKVRYHVPADKIQSTVTKITKEIFNKVNKEKDVEVAYPHTEVIFRKK